MDGVAYTTGNATQKEIHFSLDYIKKVEHRGKDEITGVLVHEVVHCYQHTGRDTCPGGLIEGVAGMFQTFSICISSLCFRVS